MSKLSAKEALDLLFKGVIFTSADLEKPENKWVKHCIYVGLGAGRIAAKLGLAFQIQDDILDVTSTLEVLGKPIGSDEKNNKSTYVTFEGLDKAKEDVEKISKEACDMLEEFGRDSEFLHELFIYLIDRDK